jgi:hypothetical protein
MALGLMTMVSFFAETGVFLLVTMSKSAVDHNKPPVQLVPGAFSLGVKRLEYEAHLHLVLKLRMY